jgi:hypothetical protein
LTTGLGVAAMVKAFGIGFLARPRCEPAAHAREASRGMVAGMTIAALACVVLAVAPMILAPALRRALGALPAGRGVAFTDFGAVVRLPGVHGSIAPAVIAAALAAAVLAAVGLAHWRSWRRPEPVTPPLWACGADDLTERMQYTATSFAEPLQRVFDDVLRPDRDLDVSHLAESRYFEQAITYRTRTGDAIERGAYRPLTVLAARWGEVARRAQNGSVHRYLAFGFAALVIVLVVLA